MVWDNIKEEDIRESLLRVKKEMAERGIKGQPPEAKNLPKFVGQDVWDMLSEEQKENIILNEQVRIRMQSISIDRMMNPLDKQISDANEVIKFYDNLENILLDWSVITGQKKGTAKAYLEKWEVE